MEKNTKSKALKYLNQALELSYDKVLLVSKAPAEEGALIHAIPRIAMILEGQAEYSFFKDNELKTIILDAGSAFYCGMNGYLYMIRSASSRSVSICFYGEYLRVTYSEFNDSKIENDFFYHTDITFSAAGHKLLEVFDEITKNKRYEKNAAKLLELLLLISIEDVERSNSGGETPSGRLWAEIDLYIRLHFHDAITRKSIAEKFQISPSYTSHLIKKISGHDFTAMLTEYRLEHAVSLLNQTWQSIDEIAEHCGFKYTSYFITRFKKRYGITPHVFRKKIATNNTQQ
jgi:AraC-like DNA-binding protein